MGDVVVLPGITKLPIPVERVLDGAKHLESVLVLGWTKDGKMWSASSEPNLDHGVYLATRFVHKVHHGDFK